MLDQIENKLRKGKMRDCKGGYAMFTEEKQATLFEIAPLKLPFKKWQIREGNRLYSKGAKQLSDTELLAHLVRDQNIAPLLLSSANRQIYKSANMQIGKYANEVIYTFAYLHICTFAFESRVKDLRPCVLVPIRKKSSITPIALASLRPACRWRRQAQGLRYLQR
jgi:hypothetical protein